MTSTTTATSGAVSTAPKTKSTARQFVKPAFKNAPLAILYSARVRLNDEERSMLKTAYDKAYNAESPLAQPAIGGSTISVSTAFSARELDLKLGMGRIAAIDFLTSRDTLSLAIVLKFQKVLGVEVFTATRLEKAFQEYLAYIFTVND